MGQETERLGDVNLAFHREVARFLLLLDGALRQAQIYEPDNRILTEPRSRLESTLPEILKRDGAFGFQIRDGSFFVQGERLRCGGTTFLRLQELMDFLKQRHIEGIRWRTSLDAPEWGRLLEAMARYDRRGSAPFDEIARALCTTRLDEKVELLRREVQAPLQQAMAVQIERRQFAIHTYAKTMLLLRAYIDNLGNATRRGYYHLKLQRAVQDLVTVCLENGWKYFGLVNTKQAEGYLYHHSTHVAVLSLLVGVRMNLSRARLTELGMAAILHDLGKALLPRELMEKPGAYTEEDRVLLAGHPTLGIQAMLQVRQYNEGMLKRVRVMCEHHRTPEEGAAYHPYSRIIAVAETFDALTSRRPFRAAYLPDDAMRVLLSLAGKRLDRDVVSLFLQTAGLYPPGTLIELSSGEKAVVFHPHPDLEQWRTPIVRIVRDAAGAEIPEPRFINLADAGFEERKIVRALDPAAAGINVSGYLYADADGGTGIRRAS